MYRLVSGTIMDPYKPIILFPPLATQVITKVVKNCVNELNGYLQTWWDSSRPKFNLYLFYLCR